MPYILANIIIDYLSVALLCVTGAMLLDLRFVSRYVASVAGRVLFVAVLAALIALLAWGVSSVLQRYTHISRVTLFDVCFYVGTFNTIVVVYDFMNRCCFLNRPRALRRVLIAALSIVATLVPVTVVVTVVTALFVIK